MWHKQRFINSMTYLLDALGAYEANALEALILIMIHHFNSFNEAITLERLAQVTHATISQVDDALEQLQSKGYLVIESHQGCITFNVDALFHTTQPNVTQVSLALHETFEQSFKRLLTEKEYSMIALWATQYSEGMILNALRQALINNKTSIPYIGKILDNWKKAKLSDADMKHE